MICYLDASALVKRYVAEAGAPLVAEAVERAEAAGTAIVSRVEVVAAFAKAVRFGALSAAEAEEARREFHRDWQDLVRLHVTELMTERAALLAWELSLRGYDAVQLAAALTWRDLLEQSVAMVTFDRRLWEAALTVGLGALPADLPGVLERWRSSS